MIEHVKRLLGIGTRVKPITTQDVEPSQGDPVLERRTEITKRQLYNELVKLEQQSIEVRKLLANEALDLVARPGRRK